MKKKFRAILLAAGLGTRLRPLTLKMPKCMVDINGKPLLGNWLTKLENAGCEAVLINTHLAEAVVDYINNLQKGTMDIRIVHERELLGTAGTLIKNQDFFRHKTGLLIHADNAMRDDLNEFLEAHEQRDKECMLTMLTFLSRNPSTCGIVELDNKGIVKRFHEKVKNPPGNLANGAVYAFDWSLIKHMNEETPDAKDFGKDVIPSFMGRIKTWNTMSTYLDIGTPEALALAQRLFKESL